jgi:hypothetical protein
MPPAVTHIVIIIHHQHADQTRSLSAGNGQLEPPKSDAAARAAFLQWTISAEPGLTVGLMDVFWHTMQFPEEQRKPQIAERGREL